MNTGIDVSSFWCNTCNNYKYSCTCSHERDRTIKPLFDYFPKIDTCDQCGNMTFSCSCCRNCGKSRERCDCWPYCQHDRSYCTCCENCHEPRYQCTCCKTCGKSRYLCMCNSLVPSFTPSWTPSVYVSPETEVARNSPRLATSLLRTYSQNETMLGLANSETASVFARQGRGTRFTTRRKIFGFTVESTEYRIEPY